MPQPIAGWEGRVQVDGLTLYLDSWRVNPSVGDVETTNFESVVGGVCYEEGIFGKHTAEVEFSGYWDADQSPHANPPNFTPGVVIANLYLYVRKTGNRRFWFPLFRILSVPVQAAAKDNSRVEVSIHGKNQGIYFFPS